MKSYESSKWWVKIWRSRWYIYAIYLHTKNLLSIYILIDLLLYGKTNNKMKTELRSKWKDILKHVRLSKMNKFT